MRVWVVNQYAVTPSQPGITRHFMLARQLVERGHEVTIFASSFNHVAREETRSWGPEICQEEVVEGVSFLWVRTPPYRGNTLARVRNMLVFARRLRARETTRRLAPPDVLIGSSPPLFAALATQRLARRHGAPFVMEVRDLWPESAIALGDFSPNHPAVWYLERIERHLYRQATRVITVPPRAGDHIAAKGADPTQIVWLPNGVDLTQTPAPGEPSGGDPFTAMYAGAHGLANGLDSVLDAAAILQRKGWPDRVRFRLVGDGPEKTRLRRRAESEGIRIVQFDDPIPKTEVHQVLQEADVFLMVLRDSPIFRWGVSPNKLFDYLAAGRPVIFSVGSPVNPVADAKAGITVPPEDARAMAEAIKQLADMSPEQRWEMGLRGRKYVEEHHDIRRLAEKLEQVLLEVVRERQTTG